MWLHLLFNTIFPFIILVAMNLSIYRKLVSVSHIHKAKFFGSIKFFSQSRYHIEESGDRKRKDSGEES